MIVPSRTEKAIIDKSWNIVMRYAEQVSRERYLTKLYRESRKDRKDVSYASTVAKALVMRAMLEDHNKMVKDVEPNADELILAATVGARIYQHLFGAVTEMAIYNDALVKARDTWDSYIERRMDAVNAGLTS